MRFRFVFTPALPLSVLLHNVRKTRIFCRSPPVKMLRGRLAVIAVLAITCLDSAQRILAQPGDGPPIGEGNDTSSSAQPSPMAISPVQTPKPTPAATSPAPMLSPTTAPPTVLQSERSTSAPTTTTPSALIDTTASGNGGGSEDEYTSAVIVLAVLLAALVLCNIIACFVCKKRKSNKPRAPPPSIGNGASASAGLPPPLSYAEQDLVIARNDLDAERKRRIYAEALIQRTTPGGIRVSAFPGVGEVNQHVEHLATIVLQWTSEACVIVGSDPALPMTLQSILVQTFTVCSDEVKRCIANRVDSLSDFLGSKEPVSLGGQMNLDTSYVLYECLTRNFESIVSVEPDHMGSLSSDILQRCAGCADERLAKQMIVGDAWPLFEAVMQNYIRIFIECALQNGPMIFNDDVGKKTTFDAVIHRDWAPHSATPHGQQCCIVFPGLAQQEGRPASTAKIGVVRVNA